MIRTLIFGLLILGFGFSANAKTCQRLEGVNMECSPDVTKPCQMPRCAYCVFCKNPTTYNRPIISGGQCTAYETVCSGSGENQTCSQVCTQRAPTTCTLNPVQCAHDIVTVQREMIEPGCPPHCKECPAPPEGYQKCDVPACEPDGQCPPT